MKMGDVIYSFKILCDKSDVRSLDHHDAVSFRIVHRGDVS